MTTYDAIIIGTGQAGPALARRLAGAGMKVAIVERGRFGGTCVNTGCTPTKTLVASAYAMHVARRGADYGFSAGDITVDMKRVKARKDEVAGASTRGVERSLRSQENCTVYTGHARLRSPREVEVGNEVLQAEKIFLNVGGRAAVPDIPGLDQVDYLTNSSMMDVDFLPQSSRGAGRQLHRARVRPDVSPLRQPGHDRRAGAAPDRARGRGRLAGRRGVPRPRGHRRPHQRQLPESLAEGRRDRPEGLLRAGPYRGLRLPPAAGDGTAAQHRRSRARPRRREAGQARLHRGRRRASDQRARHLGAGRLQRPRRLHPHRVERLRDRGRQPSRRRAPARQRSHSRLCALHRPAARPRRHDGGGGPQERPPRAGRPGRHGGRLARLREGRDRGLHEGPGRRRVRGRSWAPRSSASSGDEVIHCVLDAMYAKAPYTVLQRAMHIHPTVAEFIPTMLGDLAPLSG